MPLATFARRAGALLLAGAGLISATGTAQAATATGTAQAATAATYTAVVFPDQDHTVVYNLINSATRTVDVTMYELRDTTAVNALIARQKAGVKVRVILDGQHTSVNGTAYSALKAAGVGVTYSSSAFVYTHQKTVTVDGATSLIMTGNLDSVYYANDRDYGVVDTDANDVAAIEQVFAADYAKTSVTPSDGDNLVWSPTDSQTRLLNLINGARSSLDVEQLEFGDQALVDAITAAANRGVTVRVVGMNPSSYGSYFDQVTAAGAKVVTYSSTTGLYIHAKAIVADYGTASAKVFAGSENFSDNSLNNNRELGLIVSDSGVLNTIESTFATDFANGTAY
ncbi:phosphatidylserine/phosphatidylglycerophosphate/cardiolipin synthase family protein [Streptomyces sp. FH025]|uniref:phospholipase D-like domain-containing protein n=1 Tax=Streptomyces sp. FH025 TaxID=2815937 RepID=UPI001A9FD6BA|nr:phospholipase D-like domain-containing protein [Streptomyces sp. FH025]MBO1418665.1 cardiolipin synthase [Streptomyces sp. FH025]